MSKDTQIPVGEFMKIRDAVADELRKGASAQTQKTTLVRQAEQLLISGFIDIDTVREALAPPTNHQTLGHPDTITTDEEN